eukprot:g30359.t1
MGTSPCDQSLTLPAELLRQPEPTPSPVQPEPPSSPIRPAEETNFEELFEILRAGFDPPSKPSEPSEPEQALKRSDCASPEDKDKANLSATVHSPPSTRPAKRPRSDGVQALVPAWGEYDGPPPPDKVADAYRLLNLSLSSSRKEVQKRFRHLARGCHPDKAKGDQRVRATRMFRQLQDAKGLILSWLDQRAAPQLEESDDSFCFDTDDEFDEDALRPDDVVFGEAGDACTLEALEGPMPL